MTHERIRFSFSEAPPPHNPKGGGGCCLAAPSLTIRRSGGQGLVGCGRISPPSHCRCEHIRRIACCLQNFGTDVPGSTTGARTPRAVRVTLEHAARWPGGKAGLCRCEEADTYVCAHVCVHALSHTRVHTPTGNAATRGVCYVLTRRGLASKGTPGKGS